MQKSKNRVGRPKLPEDQLKQYQRIAVYSHTYKKLKKDSQRRGMLLVDYIEKLSRNSN